MTAGGVFQAPAATSWVVAKSLACQKIARRPCEGSFSCWIRVSILPFVRPSWGHLIKSCHLLFYFVWSSVPSGIFASRRQYEGNKKLPDCLMKVTRIREALAMPSSNHRIIVRWHRDGTTVSAKTAEFENLKRFPGVMVTWTYKGQPQRIFLSQS